MAKPSELQIAINRNDNIFIEAIKLVGYVQNYTWDYLCYRGAECSY